MTQGGPAETAPVFGNEFRTSLEDLFLWRRDVRRFRPDPVSDTLVGSLLELAALAPSVGNSQPWRFVSVDTQRLRGEIIANFNLCNAAALACYEGDRAALYARLKLAGLNEAPVHLAVFCDHATQAGLGLGRKTMPEALDYSVVAAVHTFWLAARTHGLGVGWVSILDPLGVAGTLSVPSAWKLIAYLCVGFPQEDHMDPELQRHHWQARIEASAKLHRR
jgi:5,6-dimethylbenzimidazole synthase